MMETELTSTGCIQKGTLVQILQEGNDGNLQMDTQALERILLSDKVGDRPIAVISIVGAMRTGKSFLLNLLRRYLDHRGYGEGEWLKNHGEDLNEGIGWQDGPAAHTTGIQIWSEPFIVTNTAGDEIAVLLADTQGCFDHKRSGQHSINVLVFSTVLSTLQIFNVSKQIRADDLDYLQCFTEYARLNATSLESGNKSEVNPRLFQSLLFLVRDWPSPDAYPYGSEGGLKYLGKCLSTGPYNRPIRKYLKNCFEELLCFLMPMPSEAVMVNIERQGVRNTDLGSDFEKHVKLFTECYLNPEMLAPKKICGTVANGRTLLEFMKTASHIMKERGTPELSTIMQLVIKSNNAKARDEASRIYETQMADFTKKDFTSWDEFEQNANKAQVEATAFFRSRTMYGGTKANEIYLAEFERSIQQRHAICKRVLDRKRDEMYARMIEEWKHKYMGLFAESKRSAFTRSLSKIYKDGLSELESISIFEHLDPDSLKRRLELARKGYFQLYREHQKECGGSFWNYFYVFLGAALAAAAGGIFFVISSLSLYALLALVVTVLLYRLCRRG